MSNQPPQITLTVRTGPQPGQVFQLVSGTQTIGRTSGNQIVISDPTISRKHVQITVQPEGAWIQDLGSANGTFVNGQRITTSTWLKPGDTVQVGTSVVLGVQAAGMPVGAQQPGQPGYAPPGAAPRPSSALGWILPVAAVMAVLVLAAVGAAAWYFWSQRSQPSTSTEEEVVSVEPGPNVVVYSPAPNAEASLNKPLLIHASARDPERVSKAELWVGGRLVARQESDLPEGLNPFTFAPVWAPAGTGDNVLLVRAYSTDGRVGESGLVPLNVTAPETADADAPSTRVIQEGETLEDISQETEVPVEQIIELNPGLEEVIDLSAGAPKPPEKQVIPAGTIIVMPPDPNNLGGAAAIPPPMPFPPPPPPPPPAPLVVVQAGCNVHLYWTPVGGSAAYRIYRMRQVGQNFIGGFLTQVGGGQTSFADAAGNGDWWYAVAAVNAANQEVGFTGYKQIVLNNCQNPLPAQQVALELLDFVPDGKDIRCSIGAGPQGGKVNAQNVKMIEGQELLSFPAQFNAPVEVRFECIDWGPQPPAIFGSHEKKFFANDVVNNQVIYRGVGYSLLGGAFEIKYRLCLAPCPPVDKNAPVTTGAPETPVPPAGVFPPPSNLTWTDDPNNPNAVILSWDWTAPAGVNPQAVKFRVYMGTIGPTVQGGVNISPYGPWQSTKKKQLPKGYLSNVQCKHSKVAVVLAKGPGPNDMSESELVAYKQLDCPAQAGVTFQTLKVSNLKDGQPGDNTMEVKKALFFVNEERQEVNLGTIQNGVKNLNVPPMTVNLKEKDDINIVVQLFDEEVEGTANPLQVIWCFPRSTVQAASWVGGLNWFAILQPSPAFIDERNKVNPPVQADCEVEVLVKEKLP